jgi:hypothetical protein
MKNWIKYLDFQENNFIKKDKSININMRNSYVFKRKVNPMKEK